MMTNAAASDQKRWAFRGLALAGMTVALLWPALINKLPLLFPDALGYVRQSRGIVLKLRGFDVPYWSYEIMRSEIYSASMFFLHRGPNLWPIVGVQALLTAWVLWLVVRTLQLARPMAAYLVIGGCLASLTGIAWYAASLMPDILGPVAYLSIYLLVMASEALGRWERRGLAVLTLWCVTAHATHLLLGAGVCCVFAVLWRGGWRGVAGRGGQIALVAGILVVAVMAQLLVHRRLYGQATLYGRPPAFLMARLIGDGPARLYLQQHCGGSPWLICTYASHLPTTEEQFLWESDGIEMNATMEQQMELRREEMPLLLATMRTYPKQQALISLHSFWQMLITMGPWDYWAYGAYTPGYLEFSVPGFSSKYPGTLQAQNALPQARCRAIEGPVVLAALAVVVCLLPFVWRARNYTVLALAAVVAFVLPVNAFLSGVISTIDPRLQDRVTWMIVFLAGLMVYTAVSFRRVRAA